jgi:hypothetical protein
MTKRGFASLDMLYDLTENVLFPDKALVCVEALTVNGKELQKRRLLVLKSQTVKIEFP